MYTHRLPLVDALSGTTVQLQHLDGSPIKIPVDEVGGAFISLCLQVLLPAAAAAQREGRRCCEPAVCVPALWLMPACSQEPVSYCQCCISQVVTPDTVKVVRGKGMPISKSPGQHGDLRIKFKVRTAVCASCACRLR